jgi:hypothetical protein
LLKIKTNYAMKLITITLIFTVHLLTAQSQLPIFTWEERPEWINIKTELTPAAVGDGITDDTQALQNALNLLNQNAQVPKVIYLPSGTYRVTQTLNIPKSVGALIIGQGSATTILYDGAMGGELFHTYGFSRGQMQGLILDGNNKNTWLISHNATKTQSIFEGSPRYRYVQFRNAAIGLQGGQGGSNVYAASEMEFDNCLFFNCGVGIEYNYYNYYNEFIHHCEFWNCGTGISAPLGNVYVEQCHFRNSTNADIKAGIGHGQSIRRCSSFGSKRFIDRQNSAKLTLQDCMIGNYTDPTAIYDYISPCWLFFDINFQNPPNNSSPIFSNSAGAPFILSNVTAPNAASLYPSVSANNGTPLIVPNGAVQRVVVNATQSFFIPNPNVAGKVFDAVRDFGAIANDNMDDTQAIQNTINAAKSWGNAAIAYFPTGQYQLSSSIVIDGANYFVGGSGYGTQFKWTGTTTTGDIAVFRVNNAQNVIIENLQIPSHLMPANAISILHTATTASHVIYDNVFAAIGAPTLSGNTKKGFYFKDLSPNASVFMRRTDGGVFIENSGDARIYGNFVQTPPLVVSGSKSAGYLGFLCVNGSNGVNLQVSGNQNLTIANIYSEQSGGWGTWGTDYNFFKIKGTGKVTVGGQKMHLVEHRNMFNLENFDGRLAVVNGFYNLQNPNSHYKLNAFNSNGQVLFMGNNTGANPMLFNPINSNLTINQLNNYDRTLTLPQTAGVGAQFTASPVALAGTNVGHALKFDGLNDYAIGTLDDNHYKIDGFSVSLWVRPDAAHESGLLVGVQPTDRDSSGNDFWMSWRLELVNGKVQLRLRNNSSNPAFSSGLSTTTLSENQWNHIVATWDRQNAQVFVNGVLESSGLANFTNALTTSFSTRFTIGGSAGSFLNGALDEVQFFRHRILTSAEITATYNNGNGVFGNENDVNLYHGWHFDTPNQGFSPDYTAREAFAVLYEHNVNHNSVNALSEASDVLDDFRRLGTYAASFNLPINMSTVLRTELLAFTGIAEQMGNQLVWQFAETNTLDTIEVQKSKDSAHFIPLSNQYKNAAQTAFDNTPFDITYYRLKIKELAGKTTFSKTISLKRADILRGVNIYPNPVNNVLFIENAEGKTVEIINILGQIIKSFSPNNNQFPIAINELNSGIYFIKINNELIRFVKN